MNKDAACKIKLSGALAYEGDISLELAHHILGIAIGGTASAAPPAPNNPYAEKSTINKGATAKSFVATKRPRTDVEKVACLAFFLTHLESTPKFKTADLERAATDAAIDISNLRRAVDNATRQSKFLVKAGEGTKQITTLGESVVEAMPNKYAVAAILKEKPARRRKRKSAQKKK